MLQLRRAQGLVGELWRVELTLSEYVLGYSFGPWMKKPGAEDGTAWVRPVAFATKAGLRIGWLEVVLIVEPVGALATWHWRLYVIRNGMARCMGKGASRTQRGAMRQAMREALSPAWGLC